jgi:hypothetical protein
MTSAPQTNIDSNSASDDGLSDWQRQQPPDGSFDVAGVAGWMARRAMQVDPTIEANLRSTVRGMVGGQFTGVELKTLEDRALDGAEMGDLKTLQGIEAGPPVFLTPSQKARVDGLMPKLGSDALGGRARDAYGKALKNGQIRVR